jgi:glycosyltransferase involved in cell wall biosynthesis
MQPLLTIAIPTYNRAMLLEEALRTLLPQIAANPAEIELIISDNASNDPTQEVIKKCLQQQPAVNATLYLQANNTGYYGNFRKCKELSNGKYFWLLSDNEHIQEGVVNYILSAIRSDPEGAGAYYLSNNDHQAEGDLSAFSRKPVNMIKSLYAMSLISSVVLYNDKRYDQESFSGFRDNSFLGFIFLCNALRINNSIIKISGCIYTSQPCHVYFDIFRSWTKDIMGCVNYMMSSGLLDERSKTVFISGFLKDVVHDHIFNYLTYGILAGKKYGTKTELKELLSSYYGTNPYFIEHILPLFSYPQVMLRVYVFNRKVLRFCAKRVWSIFRS